jgi:HEPN domain-containing protein
MKNRSLAEQWLGRAKSNLIRAKLGKVNPDIFYEDLCFDCQQAGEKALKALLILRDIVPPPTHSLSVLFESLETHGITIPGEMKGTVALSYYAVTTRYPGQYEAIVESDYKYALGLAELVVAWVEEQFWD